MPESASLSATPSPRIFHFMVNAAVAYPSSAKAEEANAYWAK
jgi:hypothetical protein